MRPAKPSSEELRERASKVRLLVFDVDGVLTDGFLYYGRDGETLKRFDVKDGQGIVLAARVGLNSAILSARSSPIVDVRGQQLGLAAVLQGCGDKVAGLGELLSQLKTSPNHCAYMGDDVNDLGPMEMVGLSACPVDAVPEVRSRALFVTKSPGGRGAARELVELCLKASGRWEAALDLVRQGPPTGKK